MSVNFSIEHRKSKGNLHVRPRGDFDGSSAFELVNLLHEKYDGEGRVIIYTRGLCRVYPFGCSTFQDRLNVRIVPAEQIWFSGEKGFEIAPRGSRVIVATERHRSRCSTNFEKYQCPEKMELNFPEEILHDANGKASERRGGDDKSILYLCNFGADLCTGNFFRRHDTRPGRDRSSGRGTDRTALRKASGKGD
ncbi:MAG TPA: hypothetical protein VJ161_08735 [Geobacteraceae bacterium]|nr:hypothetical protein [Geobacteraceae bacterium]